MLIRDNDDATIGACYTMKNQLQDTIRVVGLFRKIIENFIPAYIMINHRIEEFIS